MKTLDAKRCPFFLPIHIEILDDSCRAQNFIQCSLDKFYHETEL